MAIRRLNILRPALEMVIKNFLLRSATVRDASDVAQVLVESRRTFLTYLTFHHTYQETETWVSKHLIPNGGVTIALVEQKTVAVLAVTQTDEAAWIDQLYVLPGFENQGLGTHLLTLAHETHKLPIRLFTFQQNTKARRFYERNGYVVVRLSDGQNNEEKQPDVLYELKANRQ